MGLLFFASTTLKGRRVAKAHATLIGWGMAKKIPRQLAFEFGALAAKEAVAPEPVAAPVEATPAPALKWAQAKTETGVVLEGEALPPESSVGRSSEQLAAERYVPTDGQRENAILLHRISKFEDRANISMRTSVGLAVLAVLAKGGIPLSSALLEQVDVPGVGDGRLLTGLLTMATIIIAVAAVYYVLQIRHHAIQMQLPEMRRTLAGDIAQAMLSVGTVFYAVTILGVVAMCLGDMHYALATLRDHLFYTMTGWDPVITP